MVGKVGSKRCIVDVCIQDWDGITAAPAGAVGDPKYLGSFTPAAARPPHGNAGMSLDHFYHFFGILGACFDTRLLQHGYTTNETTPPGKGTPATLPRNVGHLNYGFRSDKRVKSSLL
jgi:hypothetical protein